MARPVQASARIDTATIDGLVASLAGVSKSISANVMAGMVRDGAKVAVKSIKPKVPVGETGDTQESISFVVRKRKHKGTAVAVVGPTVQNEKGERRPSRRAHLLEFGYTDRSGVHHPGQPFMRPGTEEAKDGIATQMVLGFNRALLAAARRNTRKVAKS